MESEEEEEKCYKEADEMEGFERSCTGRCYGVFEGSLSMEAG